ncbi:MAG: 4-hydroxybenzoate octaprenyltransferase [Pseudomonadota bacterium]
MSQSSDKLSQPDDGRVADATDLNWVDRFAPRWSRPYLRLSRADRPAGTWLLVIPCWWGVALAAAQSGGWSPTALWTMAACFFGAFLMRGAGCTWNDLTDQEFDAQVARTRSRPLPSGQVSRRAAFGWLVAQALIAFGILLTLPPLAIALGIASLLPVAIYPFAKRFTWWPQVFLGIAFNWGVLLGFAAVAGTISSGAIMLYLAALVWTLFYDTIYALQDTEDDAIIGVKSTARLFGERTPRWLFGFLVVTVLLTASALIVDLIAAPTQVLLAALVGAWGMGLHLAWQLKRLHITDPAICLQLFRTNRDAGLILALALALAATLA